MSRKLWSVGLQKDALTKMKEAELEAAEIPGKQIEKV